VRREEGARRAWACEDLEDAAGEACFLEEGRNCQGAEGSLFGWFDDQDVACCECWGSFDDQGCDRGVERVYGGADAEGFVADKFDEAYAV